MSIILAHHTIISFQNAVTIEDRLADECGEQRVAYRWVCSSSSRSHATVRRTRALRKPITKRVREQRNHLQQ